MFATFCWKVTHTDPYRLFCVLRTMAACVPLYFQHNASSLCNPLNVFPVSAGPDNITSGSLHFHNAKAPPRNSAPILLLGVASIIWYVVITHPEKRP